MDIDEITGLVRLLKMRSGKDPVSRDALELIVDLLHDNERLMEAVQTLTLPQRSETAELSPEDELAQISREIAQLGSRLRAALGRVPAEIREAFAAHSDALVLPDLVETLRRDIEQTPPRPPRVAREQKRGQATDVV